MRDRARIAESAEGERRGVPDLRLRIADPRLAALEPALRAEQPERLDRAHAHLARAGDREPAREQQRALLAAEAVGEERGVPETHRVVPLDRGGGVVRAGE